MITSYNFVLLDGISLIALKHRIRLMPSSRTKLYDVIISSDPHSFFHHTLKRASKHFRTLALNAEAFPHFPVSDLEYLSSKDLDEINLLAYGTEDDQIAAPEFLDELFEATA